MTTVIYCYRPSLRDEGRIAQWMASRPEAAASARDLTPDRPELTRALAGVRAGAIRLLAACRLADLGLTAPQLGVLLDEFAASGAVLAFVIDPIDPMTPDGRRLALFLADAVEAQRRVQAERQRDGLDRARAAGKRIGGRPAGLRVRLTPPKQALVEEMIAAGKAAGEVAEAVGLSRRTVTRFLATRRKANGG